jgi:predicted RNA binding protein YcfA (HicA-like mRNA interferase family)
MNGINRLKLIKIFNFLRDYGFKETRQKASHLIFTRQGSNPSLVLDLHCKKLVLLFFKNKGDFKYVYGQNL